MSGQALVVPVLPDDLFEEFRQLIHRETGITMRDSKKLLVTNRVKKRMRQAGIDSFPEYLELVLRDQEGERIRFVDAITTNETWFLRGENHFVALRDAVLPQLFSRRNTVTMWSVGCSSGEEPYSLAIVAHEAAGGRGVPPVEILATDICTSVIDRAGHGAYDERSLRLVPPALREKYFSRAPTGEFMVRDEVKRLVRFRVHNAVRESPPARERDVIFCRNLMIYFDRDTQKRFVDERLAPALAPDGFLFIGHSESLIGKSQAFTFTRVNQTPLYRLAEGRTAP